MFVSVTVGLKYTQTCCNPNVVTGNVCFTVPVAVHGTVMDFAVGLVDSDGDAHPNPPIYLHAIPQNPEMSSPSFRYIRFGVQFRADPVRSKLK